MLLHSISAELRKLIGGPFHLLQAVPIFIIITGYHFASGYQREAILKFKNFINKNVICLNKKNTNTI